MCPYKNRGGFTLIEILVAMAIFAFIALGTAGAVSRSLKVKKITEEQWDRIHAVRTALSIMTRDLYLAFHRQRPERMFGSRVSDRERWFKSYFKAKEDHIFFTSLSHRKLYENRHESELSEISYTLTPDPDRPDRKNITRRSSPYIDDNPEEGGKSQIILSNVKTAAFRFYSKKNDRWTTDWDTEHRDFGDQFPDAVEIKFTLLTKDREKTYTTKVILAHADNDRAREGGRQRPREGQGREADRQPPP